MLQVQKLLFHDDFSKRAPWYNVFKDPVWVPKFDVPLADQRTIAYNQLALVAKSKLLSVRNFINDPTNIFTAHQLIGCVSGSATTKCTVHFNLFGGSVVALHTDRHKHLFDQIDSLEITGCFCLTELGYGNNAVKMETTATYDSNTKEFIVNTPSVIAQKYWITNGAVHANLALVFAQTIVKGKNQGINAFLIPIRDKQLKAFPGVEINDMGYKIGLNGIDNAALKFANVHIPRVNMLNKYCDVNEKGQFVSDIKGISQRFFKVTQRLLSGRLCIAAMTMGALKTAVFVTFKYSFQRMGVSPDGSSSTPIFKYQLQQNALIPILSRMLGLNMLHNFAKRTFANPGALENELLMICCVNKALVGWHAERSIAVMRERTGGQGFLAANMFGELLAGTHAALTAEGDNRVLMVKVTKDLMTLFAKDPSAFSMDDNPIKLQSLKDLRNLSLLAQFVKQRQESLIKKMAMRISGLRSEKVSMFDIWMHRLSDEIQEVAQIYGERQALFECVRALTTLKDSKAQIERHFLIFAWDILLRDLATLILEQRITPQLAGQLRIQFNQLIQEASKGVPAIIDSLNVPAHAIMMPIANDYVKYNSYANKGELVGAKL